MGHGQATGRSPSMSGRCPHPPLTVADMINSAPLVSIPVAFFDPRTGLSALAVQHLRADARTALVYHDAPGPAAARPLLSGIAESLIAELTPGQTLGMVETSMPEHPAETFIYARVALTRVTMSRAVSPGRVSAHTARTLSAEATARLCGITVRELTRTEQLVAGIHRPRSCAFAGFRQLPLGLPEAALRVVA